jgi:two-component system response regulator RstA
MMQQTILLVDDDVAFTRLVSKSLQDAGYQTLVRHNGVQALECLQREAVDLVILDVMMPEMDGLTACKQLRSFFSGPVLMLTALDEEVDEVIGLELGADDYLGKPLKPRLLLARIKALLRRGQLQDVGEQPLQLGELAVDTVKREASVAGRQIVLTDAEFDLLVYLLSRQGEIISREQLYLDVMRFEYDGLDRALDLRVSRLRKRLQEYAECGIQIKTVRAKGYLLVAEK